MARLSSRRWWQRLIRLGAAVALLLCAVYVSIPWLLPAEAIRQSLERQMSTDLGAAVRIGGMEISWTKGVVLHKIAIDSPAGFESPPMVQVDRVAAELSPLSLLFNKQLDLLSIDGLQLLLEVNAAGQLNLATLQNFSGDVQARQVSVRNGRATIQLPGQEPIYLKISNLDFTVSSEQPLAALLVSAQLEQKDTVAPLSFRMNAGSGDPIVALARLDFANVELDQLPLIDGLKLPLRKLAGRCAGSAELEVDRSGMVSDIRGNVRASELDAQPLDGPELPVIEQAGLGARASFDPITGQVRIHQLEVRLPGVELAGSAEMTADLYEGYWEAIRSVDLAGRLQPASLAGLLTGKPSLPLGLELTGPVTIHIGGQYDGTLLGVDFSAQANAAIVSRNGLTVKPVGEALDLDLKASLDRRNWQLTVEKNDLVLGSNRFSGTGTISDLRQLVRSIVSGDRQLLASQLALLEGSGSWEIRDLQPLQPLLGQPRWLENTGLSGPISGRWLIDRRGGYRVQIWAEAAADRRIMIGDIFAQPPDTPVSLNLTGTISTDQPGLRNIALDLAVGKGLFSIDKGQMLLEDVEEKQTWKAKAQYELTAIESLLDALPLAAKQTVGLQGNITGSFDALLSPIEQKFTATASLAAMEMYIGDYFYKPLNEESNLTLSAIRSADAEPTRQNRLELSGRLPWASAHAAASWPDNDNSSAKLDARLDIADAQELPTAIPALAAVQLDRMDGKATIQLSADVKPNVWDYKATLDATDMNVVFAGDKRRSKTADVPATMSLKGSLTWADGEITSGRIDDSTLKLGQSEIALHCDFRRPSTHSGRSELVEDRPVANDAASRSAASRSAASQPTSATDFETVSVPQWADFDYNLDLQGRCVLDWPARDLLPELAEAADRFGLDGSASVALNWSRAAPGRRFVSCLDAGNLIAADVPLSFNLPGQKGSSTTVHLRKPAGLPCELLIEATSPSRSGHEMLVNNLRAERAKCYSSPTARYAPACRGIERMPTMCNWKAAICRSRVPAWVN